MDCFLCQKCGFCCQLEVVLSKQDRQRLHRAGKIRFSRKVRDVVLLKKRGKYCLYYNDGCSVYDYRPEVCRRFPVQKDGSFSGKCSQMKNFGAEVDRKIVKFILNDM